MSASLRADNSDIALDFLDFFSLYEQDITCPEACQDNPNCVAYDETVDEECALLPIPSSYGDPLSRQVTDHSIRGLYC